MKTHKKLITGLLLFAVLSVLALGGKQALAATVNQSSFRDTLYVITSFENNRPKTIEVAIAGTEFVFTDSDTSDTTLNFKSDSSEGSSNFICAQLKSDEGITLQGSPQSLPGGGTSRSGYIKLGYMNDTGDSCKLSFANDEYLDKLEILAVFNVPGTNTTDAADQDAGTTCQKNSGGFSFAWAVCPILDAASGLTNALINLFEDQLSFTVGQLGSSKDPDSGASKVHQSWTLVRNIATALVVVVMLIMVFSQATSFGAFDAYTVRKMLPKLAAAVILIQISWVAASWVIDLVNAIARGLADLMYYPFGGSGNMDLFSLLANANLGGVELGVLNWAAVGVVIALGVAYLFTMIGVAFVAITALFFAVLTLIFRKILIIALLIFVPLAILAWILPGTERYWKLWRENFLKVLFMFPIAVAIIAAGRVFAYVVGSQDNGEFLSLIFILVGFFGPLFILPKTFKWGGTAMNLAGNSIMKASSKVSEKPKKFMDTRQEGLRNERIRRSQERYKAGEGVSLNGQWRKGFGVPSLWRRPLDLARSGEADPTLWGRRREQAMRNYSARGAESEEEDIKTAETKWNLIFSEAEDHDKLAEDLAFGRDGEKYKTLDGVEHKLENLTEADRIAGFNALVKYGGPNVHYVDALQQKLNTSSISSDKILAKKMRDRNSQALLGKMKYLYYGTERDKSIDGMVKSISSGSFAGMEGATMEALLESLARRGDTENLKKVLNFYKSDSLNENLTVQSGVHKAVKAFVDGTDLGEINATRNKKGLPSISDKLASGSDAAFVGALAEEKRYFSTRVDKDGNFHRPQTAESDAPDSTLDIPHTPGQTFTPGIGPSAPAPGGSTNWNSGQEVPPEPTNNPLNIPPKE